MMTQDGWPDASEFPYIALIRIRYAHQLDLEVLRIVQHAVTRTLSVDVASTVVKTITSGAARIAKAGAERPVPIADAASGATFSAFHSALFDEDLCPWPWPWPWPGPHRRTDSELDPSPQPWRDLSTVEGVRVLVSARAAMNAMVDRETAEAVGATLDAALNQLAG